ncbi:hypothetical protein GEV33_007335 [Tenebrio molitor]|uniref:Uncharacterized protein n=1 Tax=Tenebrio molitor TaxID=7067 RepID=A0A8J6HJY7_TENMO|nr:hypothetical protein GEV33_007335 [Tenebrio molitor]
MIADDARLAHCLRHGVDVTNLEEDFWKSSRSMFFSVTKLWAGSPTAPWVKWKSHRSMSFFCDEAVGWSRAATDRYSLPSVKISVAMRGSTFEEVLSAMDPEIAVLKKEIPAPTGDVSRQEPSKEEPFTEAKGKRPNSAITPEDPTIVFVNHANRN